LFLWRKTFGIHSRRVPVSFFMEVRLCRLPLLLTLIGTV
jgi:hypothetical protein